MLLSEIAAMVSSETAITSDVKIKSVSTDSRTISEGALFIPIRGERFNGYDFIEKAAENGAAAVLNDTGRTLDTDLPVLDVLDTRAALCDIAEGYKKKFNVKTVGITGSVGKTTTKEMIAAILETRYKTLKNEGNFNNDIGLPHTILKMDSSYEAAALEMGMSALGEISRLSRASAPDVAVITTIGVAHIEYLKTRENILKAKLEILDGLKKGGSLILNADEPLLWNLREKLPVKTVYFGIENEKADIKAKDIHVGEDVTTFTLSGDGISTDITLYALGVHQVYDAVAAAGAAMELGFKEDEIKKGLADFRNVGMRQKIYESRGITIIEDCYNAGPESMMAALTLLSGINAKGRKIGALGGIRELGQYHVTKHEECGEKAAESADMLFLFGEGAEYYKSGAVKAGMSEDKIFIFDDRETLANALSSEAKAGDAVLFKGSRFMKMEECLKLFLREDQ